MFEEVDRRREEYEVSFSHLRENLLDVVFLFVDAFQVTLLRMTDLAAKAVIDFVSCQDKRSRMNAPPFVAPSAILLSRNCVNPFSPRWLAFIATILMRVSIYPRFLIGITCHPALRPAFRS